MSDIDLTATTPKERAEDAGVVNDHAITTLARALDPSARLVWIDRESNPYRYGGVSSTWTLHVVNAAGRHFRFHHRFYSRSGDAPAKSMALAKASEDYGVTEWGKIPGMGRALYAKDLADLINTAIKTRPAHELRALIG